VRPIVPCFPIVLCLAALGVAADSQTASSRTHPPAVATFTSTAALVLVPVVVRQGKQTVSGLTKNDFAVFEDRVPQQTAFVKPTTSTSELRRAAGGNVFSNELGDSGEAPRLTMIAVDTINTPFVDQSWLTHEVRKFLANNPVLQEPASLIAITPNGLRLIHDFTTDTASLTTAFERASGKRPHTLF
jgi:VWFA-related protein